MNVGNGRTSESILTDIRAKTGLSFRKIGGIDTLQENTASVVLPILAEWIAVVPEENVRAAIYSRFTSKHSAPFLRTMVKWALDERSERGREILNFAIATALRPEDAEYVWGTLPGLSKTPAYYAILARLAGIPSVAAKAKLALVSALEDAKLGISELIYISEVDDPRIIAWFEKRVNDADRRLRAIARKVTDRGKRLPMGMSFAECVPDRTSELFSAEVDIDEAEDLLKTLETQLSARFPPPVRTAQFLSRLPIDKWATGEVLDSEGRHLHVYFRLEDFSTVEIVLVEPRTRQAS